MVLWFCGFAAHAGDAVSVVVVGCCWLLVVAVVVGCCCHRVCGLSTFKPASTSLLSLPRLSVSSSSVCLSVCWRRRWRRRTVFRFLWTTLFLTCVSRVVLACFYSLFSSCLSHCADRRGFVAELYSASSRRPAGMSEVSELRREVGSHSV